MSDTLEARARRGDPEAQFQMAAQHARAGRAAEAQAWLDRSAAGGHGEAIYATAYALLVGGAGRAGDPARAAAELRRAVERQSNSARRLLAVLTATGTGTAASWETALALLVEAAGAGDARAERELALLLEMASPGDGDADALLLRAAGSRDFIAAGLLLGRHIDGRRRASAEELERWTGACQAGQHPRTAVLARRAALPPAAAATEASAAVDLPRVARLLRDAPSQPAGDAETLLLRPRLRRWRALLSREECEYLIARSSVIVAPSRVVDPATGQLRPHPHRQSSSMAFWPVNQDLVVHCINQRLAHAAELPPANGEHLTVIRYRPGELYRPHSDYFDPAGEGNRADLTARGQRVRTVLVYLNQEYEGGETHFIEADYPFKGVAGDALIFDNVLGDGAPDVASFHAGRPVASGEKWLATRWFRDRAWSAA